MDQQQTLAETLQQNPHLKVEQFSGTSRGNAIMLDRDPVTNTRYLRPRVLLHPYDWRDYMHYVDPTFSKVQFHIKRIREVSFDLEKRKRELNSWIDDLFIKRYQQLILEK